MSEEVHDARRDTPVIIARGAAVTLVAHLVPVLPIVAVTPADRLADVGVLQAVSQACSVFGPAAEPLLTVTATDRGEAVAAAHGAFSTRR